MNYEPQVIPTYSVPSMPTRNIINNQINRYKMHLIVNILMVTIQDDQIDKNETIKGKGISEDKFVAKVLSFSK